MKQIAILLAVIMLASCEYRSPSAMLQEKWNVAKTSDGYKQTCLLLVEAWDATHPRGILGAVSAASKALGK
jgi:hypothetical protein